MHCDFLVQAEQHRRRRPALAAVRGGAVLAEGEAGIADEEFVESAAGVVEVGSAGIEACGGRRFKKRGYQRLW